MVSNKFDSKMPNSQPELKESARQLRYSQTDAEQVLWRRLRDRRLAGKKFRRQHPVPPYILDFFCEEDKLAIEVDGSQHIVQQAYDLKRTEFLQKQGIRVLRFWNNDVLQKTEIVLEMIWHK